MIIISFQWKNPAFCAISILLLIGMQLMIVPGGAGVSVPVGKNITEIADCNCTFFEQREGADWAKTTSTQETIIYEKQTNLLLFLIFLILEFYLILEIVNFVKEEKETNEQEKF
jgi:hypothetical protein